MQKQPYNNPQFNKFLNGMNKWKLKRDLKVEELKKEIEAERDKLNETKSLTCRKSSTIAKSIVKAAYLKDMKKAPRCKSQQRAEMFERLKDGKSSLYKSMDRKVVNNQEEQHLNSSFN